MPMNEKKSALSLAPVEKRRVRLDRDRAWDLWCDGLNSEEIAKKLNVSLSTVRKWRADENLPENHQKVREPSTRRWNSMSRLERDAYNASTMGLTYGQYVSKYGTGRTLEEIHRAEMEASYAKAD